MRIVVMATGRFAVPSFLALLDSSHAVAGLITKPPKSACGRQPVPDGPMLQRGRAANTPVFMPESVNSPEAHEILRTLRADLFFVCDYGQILSVETITLARLGGINLHGSLLPKYRGAAPVHWAVYHGEKETGVSVIHITPRLDAGPILSVRRVPIGPEETADELEERLARLGVEAVLEAVEQLDQWDGLQSIGAVQNIAEATKAPRLKKENARIDWTRSARQLADQVRAFKPWPGTFTCWNRGRKSIRLLIESAAPLPDDDPLAAPEVGGEPGVVLAAESQCIVVATGQGALALREVHPAGKRAMTVAEFLRGYPMQPGDRFGDEPYPSAE